MNGKTDPDSSAALDRLRYLVGVMCEPTETTRGGIVRAKTKKQRQIDREVAEAVVRFAFDHAGITQGHLAPSGLLIQLMGEAGGYRTLKP